MKKARCALLSLLSVAALSSAAFADDITVDSSTLFGIGQRDVSGGSKETLLPATEFLGLSVEKIGNNSNLSFHSSGWGRLDLADKSFNNDKASGSLTYGYFQYRPSQGSSSVRLGRHFIREGIINEQVDGISGRADLPMGFGLSAFTGATVHTAHLAGENSDGKGDSISGGRVTYRQGGLLEIGFSGVYESDAPKLVSHTPGNYRRVGADLWLTPIKTIDIIGHSSYNPETSHFAEHSYLVNYKPIQKLVLTGEYNQHNERSYLYSWTMFSAAALNPNDKSSSTGLNASYEINKNLETSLDYKHYSRDFGSADRFGFDTRVNYKDNTIRGGFGYHYLNAGQNFALSGNPSASYHELRCYLMRDTKTYFAALDILGDIFKDKIYNESSAWETTASLGYHFNPALALSGDLTYGRNPQFTEEIRALLRLTYNMTYTGIGGKK
jgi:hypothetical protein